MRNYLLVPMLLCSIFSTAQNYDSATHYLNPSISFEVAMDTLIQRAGISTSDSEENALSRFKDFMGARISLNVATGGDMYAPMAQALNTYPFSYIGNGLASAAAISGNASDHSIIATGVMKPKAALNASV